MAKLLYPITACFKKPEVMEKNCSTTLTETDDKKKEKTVAPAQSSNPQPGLIWKVSSGLYSIGSGAVGLGFGGVKWAASTTYTVGSGVLSATQNVATKVGVVSAKPKPKKE